MDVGDSVENQFTNESLDDNVRADGCVGGDTAGESGGSRMTDGGWRTTDAWGERISVRAGTPSGDTTRTPAAQVVITPPPQHPKPISSPPGWCIQLVGKT